MITLDDYAMPVTFRRNVMANLIGRFWVALMGFAFVPIYIHLLGIEAYGLIGFFASMMAAFAVLDLGLGVTVNRELSRAAAIDGDGGARQAARNLFRSLELIYWGVALLIGTAVFLAAPVIVVQWLNIQSLSHNEVVNGVRAMGVTALMRWPAALYVGAMMGMQQQVKLNVVTSIAATLSGLGVIAALHLLSLSLSVFFLWQAIIAASQVVVLRAMAWHSIPLAGHAPRFSSAILKTGLGFSASVTGITLLSVVLTQLDKLLLSRLLPLDIFGYYALAAAVAAILTTVGSAVESAAFPALSRLVAAGDVKSERDLYHQASQGLALLVVPATVTIVFFAPQLVSAYTEKAEIADAASPLLRVLAAGNGILALMFMPLSLQLAHGWTKLSLFKNVFAVIVFVPVLYYLVQSYGAIGAAWTWLILTLGYLLVEVPVMHSRLLQSELWRWYAQDIGVPIVISIGVLGSTWMLLPVDMPLIAQVALIVMSASFALAISAAALPAMRRRILSFYRQSSSAL